MRAYGRTVVRSDGAAIGSFARHFRAHTVLADGVRVICGRAGGGRIAGVDASAGNKGAGIVDAVEMTALAVIGAGVWSYPCYLLTAATDTSKMRAGRRAVIGFQRTTIRSFSAYFRTRTVLADGVFDVCR